MESITEGRFFVLNGVMLFVAEVGEDLHKVVGGKPEKKQRLRVIFENGTESSMYRQSLSIRLHEQDGLAVARSDISVSEIGDADVAVATSTSYALKATTHRSQHLPTSTRSAFTRTR